jgi:predicted NUDIX family NTP pyrophosphohydrolase
MKKQSAGILLFRLTDKNNEVLLVHPGGPFWTKKDNGAWSIPKGEFEEGEVALAAAKREFREETGSEAPEGHLIELGVAKQPSGKVVYAWAIEGNLDIRSIKSNTFDMEWPPKSGKTEQFPEVDKAAWFGLNKATMKLVKGQIPLLEKLAEELKVQLKSTSATETADSQTSHKTGHDQTTLF